MGSKSGVGWMALAAVLTAGVVSAPAAAAPIDTTSKAAVREAWQNRMAPNLTVGPGWTGSVSGCRPGRASDRAQRATLRSLNFVRALGGLDPVGFSDRLSAKAQKAALIMDANNALSHYPPSTWSCWTEAGAQAAGASNLALSGGTMTAGGAIALYMQDGGPYNKAVGHRRWIMYPFQSRMGNGLTSTANALYVFGPTNPAAANPNWVAWPTAGYFPAPLEPQGRWSLSAGWAGTRFGNAKVSVTRNGTALDVRKFKPQQGYGQPTVVFSVPAVRPTGVYRVAVTGITGSGPPSYRYTVRLFEP